MNFHCPQQPPNPPTTMSNLESTMTQFSNEEETDKRLDYIEERVKSLSRQNQYLQSQINELETTMITFENNFVKLYYQRKLEELLGGSPFAIDAGIIDILSSTTLYAIVDWNNLSYALGSLLEYKRKFPDKKLATIVFGDCTIDNAKRASGLNCQRQHDIDVYQVHDCPDGSVSLELLNTRSIPHLGLREVPAVIKEFVNEMCDIQLQNRELKVFSSDLWSKFVEWKHFKQITSRIIKNDFNLAINQLVLYEINKVRINDKTSWGWSGIKLKQ